MRLGQPQNPDECHRPVCFAPDSLPGVPSSATVFVLRLPATVAAGPRLFAATLTTSSMADVATTLPRVDARADPGPGVVSCFVHAFAVAASTAVDGTCELGGGLETLRRLGGRRLFSSATRVDGWFARASASSRNRDKRSRPSVFIASARCSAASRNASWLPDIRRGQRCDPQSGRDRIVRGSAEELPSELAPAYIAAATPGGHQRCQPRAGLRAEQSGGLPA